MYKRLDKIVDKNEPLIVCLLFIVSCVIRTLLANYIKVLYTYNDELYYYQIAENIARGNGFPIVRNEAINFYKILYPALISPAFLFKARTTQAFVVALINSVCMSSTVFPLYLISKKILNSKLLRILMCLFFVVFPDLTLSMTFMSEILMLPVTTWLIYGFYELLNLKGTKSYWISLALGAATFAGYLCKEIVLLIMGAYMLTALIDVIKRRKIDRDDVLKVVILALGFGLSYLAFSLLIVRNSIASYNVNETLSTALSFDQILSFLSIFVYYIMAILVSYCFFTVIIPLICYKQLDKETQKLYTLTLASLVLTLLVCIFFTNLREDVDKLVPILHFRYFTFVWMPLLIVFLKTIEIKPQINLFKLVSIAIVFALTLLFRFYDIFIGSSVDHLFLMSVSQIYYLKLLLLKIGFIVAIIVGIVLIKFKKTSALYALTLVSLLVIFVVDTKFCCKDNLYRKSCPDLYYAPVTEVSDFVTSHSENSFMITYYRDEGQQRALDTFCNYENVDTYMSYDLIGDEYYNYDYVILQNNPYDVEIYLDGEELIHNEWYRVIKLS
ncbi:MAG: glycosyltransferase family 39 protein [Saccharofermentans sp.]|nr:glycosyltransferase family 39 protein [Saccharofermentans sp.]